ncbi:MAG TPA: deoxyribodipyrimidine photo-lyase [Dokdonella sp.]
MAAPGRGAPRALVWFRDDLRLDDNPALRGALDAGFAPVPVYVHAPAEEGAWRPGAASDAWRHRSLAALGAELERRGSRLHLLAGPSRRTLAAAAAAVGAHAVFWNRRWEPAARRRDAAVARALARAGVQVAESNASLLFEPPALATQAGTPYRVFTPFWRAALAQWQLPEPWSAPRTLPPPGDAPPATLPLAALRLAPARGWDAGFWSEWTPGEHAARAALERFVGAAAVQYAQQRDRPDRHGTSRLSPHLHFGEIAPWRVARALDALPRGAADAYRRQLGWREFAHHVLHHFPHTAEANFDARFDAFPWADADAQVLDAWRRGETGVPLVDAGLRELRATGWMHNRVRMVAASFLTKNLRLHWLHGARWFWDTLVDANLADNTLGWQWVAGTGADAAPYVRVFNPTLQARRYDPDGAYVARWITPLRALPPALRHEPWLDGRAAAAGYPRPLVDLAASRAAALAAFARFRR